MGAFLLGAELLGVDAAFYLIFIGFAAIVTGFIDASGVQMELWMEWLVFAALSISLMVLFRKRLYTKFRGVDSDYDPGPTGSIVRLPQSLQPGESCRMDYRGTTWTVVNDGDTAIAPNGKAQVTRVDGTTLIVEVPAD